MPLLRYWGWLIIAGMELENGSFVRGWGSRERARVNIERNKCWKEEEEEVEVEVAEESLGDYGTRER